MYPLTFLISNLLFVLVISCSAPDNSSLDAGEAYWPVFRGNTDLTGVSASPLPEKPELLWSFETGNDIKSTPVIADNRLFLTSTDGFVYALNTNDGSLLWKFDTKDDIEASPLYLDNKIFVGNLSGLFYTLDAETGQMIWQFEAQDQIYGSANWLPVNDEQYRILVGSYDNKMYCFDAATGENEWTFETDNYINGAPATDGKKIIFGGCDEQLYILFGTDGKLRGQVNAGSYIAGSAALKDDVAYLGHYGSQVLAIDLSEQKIVWQYSPENAQPFFSSPAVNDEFLVIGGRDKKIHCLDRQTGEPVWTFTTLDDVDASPVIARDRVIAASLDGRLYILDLQSGEQLWSFEIGADLTGSPAVTGGMIFIGSEDGILYAFGERS